jgi:hypothetical protein
MVGIASEVIVVPAGEMTGNYTIAKDAVITAAGVFKKMHSSGRNCNYKESEICEPLLFCS